MVDRETAERIASEFVKTQRLPKGTVAVSGLSRDGRKWRASLTFTEPPYCHMDPGEALFDIDRETGEVFLWITP